MGGFGNPAKQNSLPRRDLTVAPARGNGNMSRMERTFKLGDKVRVRATALRHAGRIGYVDSVGIGPASGTVVLCTENRYTEHNDQMRFSHSAAILFGALTEDVELISAN